MNTDELFQKVVDTVQVAGGNGGILNDEQANRFIDYMWDATALGQTVRQIRMNAPVRDIDKLDLGQRIARHATEGVDDSVNATPTFSKIQLRTEKIRLDWELTKESLEDNIAGDDLEDHIARLMATQLGNDLEDLAINGDSTLTASDEGYALLKAFDGYHKRALDGGVRVDFGGGNIDTTAFSRAYRALARKYKVRRGQLRFWASSGLIHDYYTFLDAEGREAGAGNAPYVTGQNPIIPDGNGGPTSVAPYGISLWEVPLQEEEFVGTGSGTWLTNGGDAGGENEANHGYVELTHPDNRLWGIKREVEVYREFKPKKDAIEYTVYTRQGVQIDNLDAYVTVENVKVKDV